MCSVSYDIKARSAVITDGRDCAAARATYKAAGLRDGDPCKPIAGIADTWIETMPVQFEFAQTRRTPQARRPGWRLDVALGEAERAGVMPKDVSRATSVADGAITRPR
jgi:hypothetical protein